MFLRKRMGKNFLARWAGNWGTLRENLNTLKKNLCKYKKQVGSCKSEDKWEKTCAVHKLKD